MKKGKTIWFFGLPCSGKTTLGDYLKANHMPNAIRLDGDHVREGLSAQLGYTEEGRYENTRRVAEVCELLNNQGVDAICSFVSPFERYRLLINAIITNIHLVYVDTSAEQCESRDVKGMWEKARQGKIRGFTGYDSCFEIPEKYFTVKGHGEINDNVDNLIGELK